MVIGPSVGSRRMGSSPVSVIFTATISLLNAYSRKANGAQPRRARSAPANGAAQTALLHTLNAQTPTPVPDLGSIHILINHFPVILTIVGTACALLGLFVPK